MSKWAFAKEFAVSFASSQADLEAKIKQDGSSKELHAELAKLSKSLADATGSLPAHDQMAYEQQLKALEKSLNEPQPKSRFAFKRKAVVPAAPKELAAPKPVEDVKESDSTFSNRTDEYLSLDASLSSDLTISDLDWCIVNLTSVANISALHARNLRNTLLLLPQIAGSAMLHDLTNCVVVLGAHQFRMHTSENVDVYISISSGPIIEHCKRIRFATYPFAEANSQGYKSVQDFSHIKASPSPNWSLLSPDETVEEWPLKAGAVRQILERLCPVKLGSV